jgi:protein-L-isoaspartate(D-aspartate) O-methyltransferase
VERARTALSGTDVTVVCTDGAYGYPDGAPYDRIIATVGAWDLLPAWTLQLAPGGRIVAPVDLGGTQCSVAFEYADGAWVSRSVVLCGFMRMRGAEAGPENHAPVDSDLQVMLPTGGPVPADVAQWLTSATAVARVDVDQEFPLWLGIYCGDLCLLAASAPDERLGDVMFTYGVLGTDGIAYLGKSVMAGGPGGPALASILVAQAEAWNAHGRPTAADLSIMALPLSAPFSGIALEKRHTRLLLSWGNRGR